MQLQIREVRSVKPSWNTCLRVGVSAFLLFLCVHYWDAVARFLALALGAAAPIFLGCAMAFVLNIPMRFFERHYAPGSQKPLVVKSRRPVCLTLSLLSVAAVLALLLILVVPELAKCVSMLISQVPSTLNQMMDLLAGWELLTPRVAEELAGLDWNRIFNQGVQVLLSGFGNIYNLATGVINSVFSWMMNVVMAFIFAIYVLLGKERLARQFKALARRYGKESWRKGFVHVLAVVEESFHDYIVGQCTEAVILGALCAAGMLIFRFPYAAVVGATIGFTALIPVAGAYIGGAVGFLLILTVSPMQAVLFLVYLVCLQQIEGNIIYPKVVGTTLGLPGIWVLAAVIIGGGVWGIFGMVLGVPLASAAYRLLKEDVNRPRADK